jgi:hypothetical protein
MDLSVVAEDGGGAACCGTRPRRSASALCDRGLRRTRLEPFPLLGSPVHAHDRLSAQFSLQCRDGVIAAVRFKASACATLLAYCELIAELAIGCRVAECAAFTPQLLHSELPGVPALKRDRAVLAAAAFGSALRHAGAGDPVGA